MSTVRPFIPAVTPPFPDVAPPVFRQSAAVTLTEPISGIALGAPAFTPDLVVPRVDESFRALARNDINVFLPYVLRDEETGLRIRQSRVHMLWHRIIEQHRQSIIWSSVSAGKSVQIGVGRVLYELGRNSALRVAVVASTKTRALRLTTTIGEYIASSEPLHEIFPELQHASKVWSHSQFFVKRKTMIREPSVQALGYRNSIQGARIDLLIIDDILNFDNIRTAALREEMIEWVRASLFTRLTENSRIIILGNAFHPQDLLHTLAREPGWASFRFPILDAHGNSTWPDKWPPKRIEQMRERLLELEFARQMLCIPRTDADSRFHQAWIDRCLNEAKDADGNHFTFEHTYKVGPDEVLLTGVDLAMKKNDSADETALATIVYNTTNDTLRLLSLEAGRWSAAEISDRVEQHGRRYDTTFIIEDNGGQDFLVQAVREKNPHLRIFGQNTSGKKKYHPEYGIEGLALYVSKAKLLLPRKELAHSQLNKLVQEMLFYNPAAHTGDRLMALWIAFSRIRHFKSRTGDRVVDILSR